MKTKLNVLLSLLTGLSALMTPVVSSAEPSQQKKFETQTAVAMGSPIGLAVLDTKQGPTTAPLMFVLSQRLRLPRYTPFALEVSYVPSYGFGANLLIDAYRDDSFRLHMIDFGYFRPHDREHNVSVSRLPRRWDLTFGLGAEIRITELDWLSLDYRVYMPDPTMIEGRYGQLGRQYVDESLKGGMLCLGLAHPW